MSLFNREQNPQFDNEEEQAQYIDMAPQQDMSQTPMVSVPYPMMGREKADLLEKIKPEGAIEGLRFKLMGYEEKDKQWIKVNYLQKYAVSQVGAWELTNLVYSTSNQNISISNLNLEQINARSYATMKAAICMMLDNWDEYNIHSTSQIRYLSEIIFNTTYITLHQPLNAGIQRLIMGTQQETRTVLDSPVQRKGLLGGLFGKR